MSLETESNYPLGDLYSWDEHYSLHEDSFSKEIRKNILQKTKLSCSDCDDWWFFEDNHNPIFSWKELIVLSIQILRTKATRLFMKHLYVEKDYRPKFLEYSENLPEGYISGAKRINAISGEYKDFNHTHMNILESLQYFGNGGKPEFKEVKLDTNMFRLSGKDESCWVEGSWNQWCMFACNVLASKNTEIVCPELYAPKLTNNCY